MKTEDDKYSDNKLDIISVIQFEKFNQYDFFVYI